MPLSEHEQFQENSGAVSLMGAISRQAMKAMAVLDTPSINPSGVHPLDLRVLVRPDAAEAVTKGGIILPEPEVDKQKYAQCKATIIAVGENAFEEAAARSPAFTKPKAGDRVLIAKYHGVMITGDDGVDYRLLNDEDVTARLEES